MQENMMEIEDAFLQNKKKRKRTSPDQLRILEEIFHNHPHPNLSLRNTLSSQLGMTPRCVQIWFQNRRAKARNMDFKPSSTTNPLLSSPSFSQPPSSSSFHAPITSSTSPAIVPLFQASLIEPKTPKQTEEKQEAVSSFWRQLLLSKSGVARINEDEVVMTYFDVNTRDNKGLSLLFVAVMMGYESIVKKLSKLGADLNIRDNDGNTPLIAASVMGFPAIVKFLLDNGADVNIANDDECTPLYLACKNNHHDIVLLLLEHGAETNVKNGKGETALHVACVRGNERVCNYLLSHGASVNVIDTQKYAPLHHACMYGHLPIVKRLLSVPEIEINAKDNHGHTALHAASLMGYDAVVSCLLEEGKKKVEIEIDMQDEDGYTPLHYAVREGREEVVKCLLRAGASVETKTQERLGLIHTAARWGSVRMGKLLVDAGCKQTDDPTTSGMRPIHFASLTGKDHFVKFLLELGANPDTFSQESQSR